eukprot:6279928-Prorocentrum_lima.AAC.1
MVRCGGLHAISASGRVAVVDACGGMTERLPLSSRCGCEAFAMDAERRRFASVLVHCRARVAQLRIQRVILTRMLEQVRSQRDALLER